jgi:Lamin Tail Domain
MGNRPPYTRDSHDNGIMTLDPAQIPTDTCPLCKQRALSWSNAVCICRSCGCEFELHPGTRRCRYTHVAPQFNSAESVLTGGWFTRREVFERVSTLLSGATTPYKRKVPLTAMLAVLMGALTVIPILFACLSALLISPGIVKTRSLIATAKVANNTLTHTIALVPLRATNDISGPISPLFSALPTPTENAINVLPDFIGDTVTASAAPTTISPSPAAPSSGNPEPTSTLIVNPLPATPPPATATLPPTFTPQSTATASTTGIPGTTVPVPSQATTPALTETPTVVPTVTVTSTATVSVTATPLGTPSVQLISGTVVISQVHYSGTQSYTWSDQYIEVQNRGNNPVNMTNWTVFAVSSGAKFIFPNGLILYKDQSCRVYGNSPPTGTSSCGALSFSSPVQVWSTTMDEAILFDNNGNRVYTYTYKNN